MEEPEVPSSCVPVKQEAQLTFCHGCRSSDRRLSVLSANDALLIGVSRKDRSYESLDVLLCWECSAVLRRTRGIQQRVQLVQDRIQQGFDLKDLILLSTLNKVCNPDVTESVLNASERATISYKDRMVFKEEDIEVKEQEIDGKEQDLGPLSTLSKVCNPDVTESVLNASERATISYKDQIVFKEEDTEEQNIDGKNQELEGDIVIKCENDYDALIDIEEPELELRSRDDSGDEETDALQETADDQLDSNAAVDVGAPRRQLKLDAENQTTPRETIEDAAAEHIADAGEEEQDLLTTTDKGLSELGGRKCETQQQKTTSNSSLHVNKGMDFTNIVEKESTDISYFECDKCSFVTTVKNTLIKHIKTHDTVRTKILSGRKLTRVDNLAQSWIHTRDKKYKCEVCEKRFNQASVLRQHSLIHTGEKPFICGVCDKQFSQVSNLKRHTLIHTGEKPCRCEVCDKQFCQVSYLKQHTLIHTGEKPFICGVCDKRFALKDNLRKHTLIHTGEKPFICGVCDKRFALKYSLRKHTLNHTGEKPFICEVCNKRFAVKQSLTIHTRVHTGERPFRCEVCDKRFTQASGLKYHTVIHTGEKPFICGICDKRFALAISFKRHTLIHTGEKPFECEVCDKRFTQASSLKQHTLIHSHWRETV